MKRVTKSWKFSFIDRKQTVNFSCDFCDDWNEGFNSDKKMYGITLRTGYIEPDRLMFVEPSKSTKHVCNKCLQDIQDLKINV